MIGRPDDRGGTQSSHEGASQVILAHCHFPPTGVSDNKAEGEREMGSSCKANSGVNESLARVTVFRVFDPLRFWPAGGSGDVRVLRFSRFWPAGRLAGPCSAFSRFSRPDDMQKYTMSHLCTHYYLGFCKRRRSTFSRCCCIWTQHRKT